ncbi:helix-turn-helix domain-containing protein [Vibrio astriarenae]|uniref:Helix-turn-helix domain-containing protein n=1 Tax=Vibrio astriarenae TaxID=1481923 RepID=A0A7Z2T2R1_9VIBR|nr:helix-turn-helix transcriptional regulator [Vibrio astriarenae]QIA63283.1 helix-turn-helix domain-containing protein [Vibrio astriarenae]
MSIERFCHVVGLSKRTLQRRLKENGHSFKQLKEIFRQEASSRLLRETALPIEEIGWKVGYNDLSNFNRAFKGWAGLSPAVYRDNWRRLPA